MSIRPLLRAVLAYESSPRLGVEIAAEKAVHNCEYRIRPCRVTCHCAVIANGNPWALRHVYCQKYDAVTAIVEGDKF